jgi:hypothetical protein
VVNMERDINHDKRPILGISQMTFIFSQASLFRASHLLSSRGKILKSSLQLGLEPSPLHKVWRLRHRRNRGRRSDD